MKGYIFLVLSMLVLVHGVPTEDEVHLTNPIYTDHHWYSGNFFFIKGTSISLMGPSIMFSLNLSMILIVTL